MAEQAVLNARLRDRVGTPDARRLRREGKVPVVVYGPGLAPRHLWLVHNDLKDELERGQRIFSLAVGEETYMTMVKEVQMDLYQENILHADFFKIDASVEMEMQVDLVAVGTPRGEREGGRPMQPVRELTIFCRAASVPERIEMDVSGLGVGESLSVGGLALPEGVRTETDPSVVVYLLQAPLEEEEETDEAPMEDFKEPEIIGRDKKEEDEEA